MLAKHVYVKCGLLLGCLNVSQEALTKEMVNLFFHIAVGKLFLLQWALGPMDIQEPLPSWG